LKHKQLSPTDTVTVAALATVAQKARNEATINTTAGGQREGVFITSII